jgi:hypothetical protein
LEEATVFSRVEISMMHTYSGPNDNYPALAHIWRGEKLDFLVESEGTWQRRFYNVSRFTNEGKLNLACFPDINDGIAFALALA